MRLFIIVALSVWFLQHVLVFWRVSSLAWFQAAPWRRRLLWGTGVLLLFSYPVARYAYRFGWEGTGLALEVLGTTWMGTLFLLFSGFVVLELLTLGGWLFRTWLPRLRLGVVLSALALAAVAVVQGQRDPVLDERELRVPHLPKAQEGLRVALLTDLHLGTRFDGGWLRRIEARLAGHKPDLILISGDFVDGDLHRVRPMIPDIATLRAPLGVWSVLGNHDVYAQADEAAALLRQAGIGVLRDDSTQLAPGLRLVGVDDLGVRASSPNLAGRLDQAFSGLGKGEACIYLSHTPMLAEEAAARGAGLMLSGHTHAGQIWPFGYLVQLRFPLFAGEYRVGGMRVFVSRGAGGWGPRMRLWKPGQVHLFTLRGE